MIVLLKVFSIYWQLVILNIMYNQFLLRKCLHKAKFLLNIIHLLLLFSYYKVVTTFVYIFSIFFNIVTATILLFPHLLFAIQLLLINNLFYHFPCN